MPTKITARFGSLSEPARLPISFSAFSMSEALPTIVSRSPICNTRSGGGKKHHAAARHTRHRDAKRVAQTQRTKTLAVDFRTRHDDVARHELTVKLVPIHVVVPVAALAFSEKDCECLHVLSVVTTSMRSPSSRVTRDVGIISSLERHSREMMNCDVDDRCTSPIA